MAFRKIGAVARAVGLSERRIREYERAGLIRLRREPRTGDRLFAERDVAQLRLVKSCIHERGFTIEALQQMIRYAPCWELSDCSFEDSCPVLGDPQIPCYQQRAAGVALPCAADCDYCLIYGSKDQPRSRVVTPPRSASVPTPTLAQIECLDARASGREDAMTICKQKA